MEPVTLASALPSTIPVLLAEAAGRFADREALVGDDRRWSWAQLLAAADEVAAALMATGVEGGDRVAIWAPNSADWVLAALGTYRAGAAIVPVNTRFKGPEVHHVLQASGARFALTVTEFLGTAHASVLRDGAAPPTVEEVIAFDEAADGAATPWRTFLKRGSSVPREDVEARAAAVRPQDTSDLVFTSGTTGAPKGAILTHAAAIWSYATWTGVVGLRADDRYLIVNPFFHVFGLKAGLLASLLTGATMLPHAVFDVPSVMARVAEERITMLPGPPTVYQSILDDPRRGDFDLSSLRLAVTGAATVPVEMVRRMYSELPFETVLTGYGLTETCGIVSVCRPGDDAETVATTAGRPIPGVEVRVVDADGNEVAPGEPGEVLVRGPNLAAGYFADPAATADLFDDGWLVTGDIGIVDDAGNVRITDRKKDMFIVGGFNAYPAEIEQVVAGHPSVSQVAVVGMPDHRLGEVGIAFVLPRPGGVIDPDELVAWCRERMANYKVPRRVEVVDAFPLNATGKVVKYELRERARSLPSS